MKQKNNIEKLYGRVVAPAKLCNKCISGGNCCKIDVPGIGLLCLMKESDALRDLGSKYKALQEESAAMSGELSELRGKNSTLETSNGHMEAELNRVREANKSLSELNDELLGQIQYLKSRGFWARVFNRQ